LKEASLDFVLTFGILGAVFGTVGATQNYSAYPVLSMPNVFSAITHCISGFASLYIIISGMESMKKEKAGPYTAVLENAKEKLNEARRSDLPRVSEERRAELQSRIDAGESPADIFKPNEKREKE
jgi:flagellar motor component MotA